MNYTCTLTVAQENNNTDSTLFDCFAKNVDLFLHEQDDSKGQDTEEDTCNCDEKCTDCACKKPQEPNTIQ